MGTRETRGDVRRLYIGQGHLSSRILQNIKVLGQENWFIAYLPGLQHFVSREGRRAKQHQAAEQTQYEMPVSLISAHCAFAPSV